MEEGGPKRIVVVIALVAVVAIGVFWYWQRAKQRALGSGAVHVKTAAPSEPGNQATGQPAEQPAPPAATTSSVPPPQSDESSPATAPAAKPSAAVEKSTAPKVAPTHAATMPPMTQPRGAVQVPVNDTIARNPPNGLIFAGAGKYQLYRQGDITWRLDTDTGRACIIFATDTLWSRLRVWDQGCGAS